MSHEKQAAGKPPATIAAGHRAAVSSLITVPEALALPIGPPAEIPEQLARLEEVVHRLERAADTVVEVFTPVLRGNYPPSACTEQPEAVTPIGGLIQRLARQLSGCADTLEITIARAGL